MIQRHPHSGAHLTVFIIFLISVLAQPLSAQKQKELLPDADKRTLLLQEAASLTNIWSPHGTPFHLRAEVSSFNGSKERKGQFEIWWASPSRFRDQITWGDQTTTHIANGDKLWTDGDDLHRRDTYRVLRLLAFSSRLATPDLSSPRAYRKTIAGQPAICIETKLTAPSLEGSTVAVPMTIVVGTAKYASVATACLDSSTNLPLQIDDAGYGFLFADYVAIGPAWFPRSLRQYVLKDELVRIHADVLEKLPPDFSEFASREGLAPEPWCAAVKPPAPTAKFVMDNVVQVITPGTYVTAGAVHEAMLVFRVDSQGHAVTLRAFDANGEAMLSEKERAKLLRTPFTPATCNGTAIGAEYIFYGFPLAR
jgi:hypothetical protein